MSNVTPGLLNPNQPGLPDVLDEHKRETRRGANCARVGVVTAFYPGSDGQSPTVDVSIAQVQITSVQEDGTRTLKPYPPLKNLPVYYPSGGNYTMTFPINVGDECLIVFHDRELDNWLINGEGQAPTTSRLHDLSDGIALVGMRSYPRSIGAASTNAVQIKSNDYSGPTGTGECIEIAPGKITMIADEVVIHARNKLCEDAGGTGTVTTAAAITGYTQGVPATNNPPTPPEIPT